MSGATDQASSSSIQQIDDAVPLTNTVRELLKELPTLSDNDLGRTVTSTISRISQRRLGGLQNAANLKPLINESEKIVLLPDTLKKPDNAVVQAMAQFASRMGYTVKLIEYGERPIRDLTVASSETGLGIYMSLDDELNIIKFNKKQDNYEIGRAYARSQQVVGLLSSSSHLGTNILKENNRYFGNAKVKDTKKKIGDADQYWVRESRLLFYEEDWDNELGLLLCNLLRKSHILVDEATLLDNIVPYVEPYPEFVRQHTSQEVTITPAKGKKAATTTTKVPSKPKKSSLLLDKELSLLLEISAPIWINPHWSTMSSTEWAYELLNLGAKAIASDLKTIYSARATFLAKMASVTTKRLQAIRSLSDTLKTKRKADIQVTDLEALLLLREDPVDSYVNEIFTIDPSGNQFIKEWISGETSKSAEHDTTPSTVSALKQIIFKRVYESHVYEEVITKRANAETLRAAHKSRVELAAKSEKEWSDNFKKNYGSDLYEKWARNIDLTDMANRKVLRSVGAVLGDTSRKEVPHESSKKQPSLQAKKSRARKTARTIPPGCAHGPWKAAFDEDITRVFEEGVKIFESSEELHPPAFLSAIACYKQFGKLPAPFDIYTDQFDSSQELSPDSLIKHLNMDALKAFGWED
jgi:hypothetical protein